MVQKKIAYVGFAIALGCGMAACSSSDTPVKSTGTTDAGTSSGGSSGGGNTGGKSGGGTTSTGGGAGTGGGGAAGAPSITITSPADNATVNASDASPDVDFSIDVKNFTLMAPGKCPTGDTACGHIHVLVDADVGDGKQCNSPGAPYNEAFPDPTEDAAGPHAGLDYCKTGVTGDHLITVELHHDNHSPVNGSDGKVVSDSVHIKVPGGDAGGPKDAGNG
jgi:hypothetical protein